MDSSAYIHPKAIVESPYIGEETRIWAWTHIMPEARIGKGCNIGENCFIENDVSIGDKCTIKNLVSVWDGVTLEKEVFVGPSVVFTNCKYVRSRQDWELSRTVVRKGVTIGAGAVIVCGINIEPFSMIAAGAVVTKSVPAFSLIAGNPGRFQGYVCVCARPLKKTQSDKIKCEYCGRLFGLKDNLTLIE